MLSDILGAQGNAIELLYADACSPICVVDSEIKIIWKNTVATQKMAALNLMDGIFTLLPTDVIQTVIQRLINGFDADVMDGERQYLHFVPIKNDGVFIGAIIMFMLSEEGNELLTKDKADRLVSTITRQTREPLTGIFSSVGILNRNIEDKSKYTEQCLKSITKNSYQILRGNLVLGEYLQYSYGCSTLSLTNKNISDFFIGVCVELENMMPSDIKFSYNIPNEGYVMAVDTEKLILVLANIVDNSCTFRNDENMSIILTVKYTGNNIIITVEDNGKGIPKEILPKIFAPYYSYVSKEIPFAGFGLGLTVSKLIIGHMGGTIAVSSEQGKGTTVAITIPNHRVAKSEMILRNRFTMTINNRFSPLTVIMSNSCDCPEM